MTFSPRRLLVLAMGALAAGSGAFAFAACSDDPALATVPGEGGDASADVIEELQGDVIQLVDAECPTGKLVGDMGETCVGFGTGTPCDRACGIPAYGYVCFNGGPPDFIGCLQMTKSSLGETYCCPELRCVAQPDQDSKCTAAGTPHRYQCPPDEDGGVTTPMLGCVDGGGGGSAVERYYCCP